MTAQAHHQPDSIPPERNLAAIRTALVVREDLEAFDSGLKATLDEVRVALDLNVLNDFVHRWWIMACGSVNNPGNRRRMWDLAAKVAAGESVPHGRSARDVLGERQAQSESGR